MCGAIPGTLPWDATTTTEIRHVDLCYSFSLNFNRDPPRMARRCRQYLVNPLAQPRQCCVLPALPSIIHHTRSPECTTRVTMTLWAMAPVAQCRRTMGHRTCNVRRHTMLQRIREGQAAAPGIVDSHCRPARVGVNDVKQQEVKSSCSIHQPAQNRNCASLHKSLVIIDNPGRKRRYLGRLLRRLYSR